MNGRGTLSTPLYEIMHLNVLSTNSLYGTAKITLYSVQEWRMFSSAAARSSFNKDSEPTSGEGMR